MDLLPTPPRSAGRMIHPPLATHASLRQPLTAGEQAVVGFFDRHLPRGWEIYVQPHLNGLRPDLVLLNPNVGIAVFEVKDWNLDAMRYFVHTNDDGRAELWAERDGEEFCIESQNPAPKVQRYKRNIYNLYCPRLASRSGVGAITAGIIFPFADSTRVRKLLEPFIPPQELERYARYAPISGRGELAAGDIGKVFPEASRSRSWVMSEALAADLRGWLVEPDFATTQREPLPLDPEQRKLVESRTALGYRRIRGPAGSGKSHVLAARAARLAGEGKSVLIVSFNITLWHYLRDLAARAATGPGWMRNITFTHFHLWCRDVCADVGWGDRYEKLWKRGRPLEVILSEDMPALAHAAMSRPGAVLYDAVLVDEGQDYRLSWWNALRKACKPGGEVMLAADHTQDIYGTAEAWSDEVMASAGFSDRWSDLRGNHRLPRTATDAVRDFASRFLPEQTSDLPEPQIQGDLDVEPCSLRWVQCEADEAGPVCVRELKALMMQTGKGGLTNADITFLTDDTRLGTEVVNALNEQDVRAVATFNPDTLERRREKMGFYMGDARVKATTLHSFKGWEGRLLVVHVSQAWTPESRALIYAGLTRLKRSPKGSWLTVVCSAPELGEYGRTWSDPLIST